MTVWTVQETAIFLHRSPGAVRNLVLRRKIPYRKIAGRLGFVQEEILRWVADSPGVTLDQLKENEEDG